ncbi:YopX family protein [Campylobacter coli]|nr:YopX family protein [Campylobacter coli]MCE7246681.1 YopX family protein [Campylobacter coli]MCE7321449.1 YopX family protein [Campylobacter coli]MCH3757423.1 YopX family protein [Campylobacter coli]MDC8055820.1 YopX family protein [Campylobacter coli]
MILEFGIILKKRYLNKIELHKYDKSPVEAGTTFTETDRINEVEFVKNKNDLEIELFTGYYDYKGNKIYIGDIIECLVFTNEKNSEIFYEIICFDMELGLCSKLSNGDGGYLFDLRRHKNNKTIEDVYVVGNIHENKELLKG